MPYLEEALYTYLQTVPTLAALVGTRIYPVRLPEGAALPALVYQRVSAQRTYTHDPFESTMAYVSARVQLTAWAETAAEAIEVGEAAVLGLSGYEGEMGGVLLGSVTVLLELDDYEPESKLYRRITDIAAAYEEELATS